MNKRIASTPQSRDLQNIVAEFLTAPDAGSAPERQVRASPARGGYACVWEFRVRPAFVADFQRAYGPDGDWAALFRRGDGYLGTELHRDVDDPLRFVTVDHWTSREAQAAFHRQFRDEYAQLDDRCEVFTVEEWLIGDFVTQGRTRAE